MTLDERAEQGRRALEKALRDHENRAADDWRRIRADRARIEQEHRRWLRQRTLATSDNGGRG